LVRMGVPLRLAARHAEKPADAETEAVEQT
jgi:hypothetical protein